AISLDNPEKRFRSYSPHITVASRNVKQSTFKAAWQDLKEQPADFTFTCSAITLLAYDTQWKIDQTFKLQQ
ncbi:MAG: 2'-5' RNA ligase family protein, partial [Leptolyngbyaceae bacterium]|nr:2'-5' RNA ligase family protein [Leptolyngbyaceae bacterium]